MSDRVVALVERYFSSVRDVHQLGAGTKERSYYPAFAELLNAIGQDLKPRVLCLSDLGNTGAGHPDFGLFATSQVQRGEPRRGQVPERGVVELKGVGDDAWLTADTMQVTKYFGAYRMVLVSNIRDFLLVGEAPNGEAVRLESFRLAPDAQAFWELVSTPRRSAERIGLAFAEYLKRALTQSVQLREPKDLAWFLASYARDALERVEASGDLPALANVRQSLEQALGVTFDREKGEHFFRSTLVQTLFYGVFSAWVLWARISPRPTPYFDWRTAVWHLTVPFIRVLFQQIASPTHLAPLRLVELLDWAAATLNRVDTKEFFSRFDEAYAVQFFYEPFLEAFDPELRKELGVWYTPNQVVDYMVKRVDLALRQDLGVTDGLAADNVFVLDPCCGTGAYLAAVLRQIDETLKDRGYGAMRGQMVKKAALERVFGFEIMPAPFVVAHLQIGLVLQSMGCGLDASHERAGVYLTNALTGWEPTKDIPLPLPELEDERRRADHVKQVTPILVILGNPPYNGFAGVAMDEEAELSEAYRTALKVRRPEGKGLNDLYVRFFRMAERRIAEKTGRGIVSFISNYSWLDGLSFTGMRERLLDVFDIVRVDSLNGDKYRTGKTTPDGRPDPSIFTSEHNREGIQVGTAITTLIRKGNHTPVEEVEFRSIWGADKGDILALTANADAGTLYARISPVLELGLPITQDTIGAGYFRWPRVQEILPTMYAGIQTSRDEALISIDRASLENRIAKYFNASISHDEMRKVSASLMTNTGRFDAILTRDTLRQRGAEAGALIKFAYRPMDVRWLYWDPDTKLLDEKRADYRTSVPAGTRTLCIQQKSRGEWQGAQVIQCTADLALLDRGSSNFPILISEAGTGLPRPNVSKSVLGFLAKRGLSPEVVFHHIAAVLHSPRYRSENAGALRMDWPRIPLPHGQEELRTSASLGEIVASLLDPESPVPGVTSGALRTGLRVLAVPKKSDGTTFGAEDMALSVGWGAAQISSSGGLIVMPGRGQADLREYSDAELDALSTEATPSEVGDQSVTDLLGPKTFDIHLTEQAYWCNIPAAVWEYKLGNYQVLKKWLSYREKSVLGRALLSSEIVEFSEKVRRIAALLLMGHQLDVNYASACATAVEWKDGHPVDS